MTTRRVAALCGVLILMALVSGCVTVPSSDDPGSEADPDPEALFEGIFVYDDALEDVDGVVTGEWGGYNQTLSERERIQERPYTDSRTETLESTATDQPTPVFISNDTTRWWYYPDGEQADRYVPEGAPYDDNEIRTERATMAETERERYDLEYGGTDQIADREAHVLDLEPKNESVETGVSVLVGDSTYVFALETVDYEDEDELRTVSHTVWLDAEYNYPLKEAVVWERDDGSEYRITEGFESVTFNSGLEEETFEFEPPDDVDVYELE
ncbi:LolA family protein [Natronolimnobius baerhuensis]|uniref:DUF2092 domain-containing protein n=1 Tax=Natronolimnobius baerhuensis TaxID=253108 RepID=A0A202ECX1_9EURY|nr:DUF2092 domain-containing protein [Natronolimnobius baerhuensis]OVE86065.1 DUF2092 domain-containing protein [Natronolimnobius baerhuensis]